MASATILKNFKYNSPQQPMFNVIEAPLNFTSFAQNNSPFKDLSFSSYLNPKDKQNHDESTNNNNSSTIEIDTEISIFDAQKYFSETNNDSKSYPKKPIQQKQINQDSVSINIQRQSSVNFRSRSFKTTTPTASSEASWNSQTGLLANPPGSLGVSLKNLETTDINNNGLISKKRINSCSGGKKYWFLIGPKSCCIGKKSVQVKETASENEMIKDDAENMDSIVPGKYQAPPRQHRVSASGRPFLDGVLQGPFSFPVLIPPPNKPMKDNIVKKPKEDPPRKSLEVFQAMLELSSALRPDHHHHRGQFKIPGSPIARVTNLDDDVGSDASSDLFEIESLSTPTNSYPMYRGRDSLEESAPPTFSARRFASSHGINIVNNSNVHFDTRSLDEPPTPSVAATECYAPSEVSIDWSVTTAEGFDKASVTNFSEMGNVDFLRQEEGVGGDGGKRRGNGGLLMMGCRQEKAVSVGPQPVKCVAEGPPIFPLHVGGRPPRANKTTAVAGGGSNAARLSLAFAA
ncbi:protein PHYTOCHROME KINASE SUBSTRATE 4-like [Henckelia pumila]|uniref:protein PHYTOCHROME KINASE SUBSTRATE 4-like n=1 Tax=Henckelia pumila TaxID=405737 RepID=UPI003C6E8648